MQSEPELIVDEPCVVGEGPLWNPDDGRVYWVDIPAGRLYRYDPASGTHECCYEAGVMLGGFTLQEDGALLLFLERGAVQVWRDGQTDTLIDEIPDERDSRFNDVIADPAGRVLCGTMPANGRLGRLYRLNLDGTLTTLLDNIDISNGLGFSPDRTLLYYSESNARTIHLFDYDVEAGDIGNRRVFAQNSPDWGVPDGLTVDAQGFVWCAYWDGSRLVRYRPDGGVEQTINFPARKVSSVTFGGPEYDETYVTTAGGAKRAEEGEHAGGLFRLRLGVHGVPEFRSRVKL
jgi:D-xylonolactonase